MGFHIYGGDVGLKEVRFGKSSEISLLLKMT